MKYKLKISHIVLILIFLLAFEFRLYYSFQSPYFSSTDAYYSIREIESIKSTGLPILEDSFKEEDSFILNPPLFYYILAFFNFFLHLEIIGKVLPSLFSSLIVFVVYLISKELTNKNESASLFSAFISAFVPVLYSGLLVNSLNPYSLVIPGIFFLLYFFIRIRQEHYLKLYVVLLIILPFIHQTSIIMILVFFIYLLLIKTEKIRQFRSELEIIIFSSLYLIWVMLLLLKNAFLLYGTGIIWQNIPSVIINNYFVETNILVVLYNLGLIPVIFGSYVIYKSIFVEKNTKLYLMISFCLAVTILLYLHLIVLELGLILLGIALSILFSRYYESATNYLEKTSISKYSVIFIFLLVFIFLITSIYPCLNNAKEVMDESVSEDEIISLLWMKDNLNNDSVVLSMFDEGNLITSIAKRKIILDTNFLLMPQINEKVADIDSMYLTKYETEALSLMTKYNIDYIYVSPHIFDKYDLTVLSYVSNEKCFDLIYDSVIKIYEVKCVIDY